MPRPRASLAALAALACAAFMAIGCNTAPPTPPPSATAPAATTAPITTTPPSVGPLTTPAASPTSGESAAPSSRPTMPTAEAIAAELAHANQLHVCLALLGAPAASLNESGLPDGYNVAFANEIAHRLALDPVIRQTLFSELVSHVQEHRCDVSVSSQNITAAREAQLNLIPYTQSKLGRPVVVSKGNPEGVLTLDDLCGLNVSAAEGSTSAEQVVGSGDFTDSGLSAHCLAQGAEAIELHVYETETDAVKALLDGDVEAYLGNPNFREAYPDRLDYAQAALPPAKQGIGVALDHPTLTAAVEVALGEMISDGTYIDILELYLPNEKSVQNFSIVE